LKQEPREFIQDLLANAGCKNIHIVGENIRCQCPFHWPEHNTDAFSISFNSNDGFGFHCFSCKEKGDVVKLISHLNSCTYKKAEKLFKKRVLLTDISLVHLKEVMEKFKNKNKIVKEIFSFEMPPKAKDESPMYEYMNKRNRLQQHRIMDVKYIISKYGLYYCDDGRYTNRIILPLRSKDGRVEYFTNRAVQSWRKKNLFEKGSDATNYLYGLYETNGERKCFLMEGPFNIFQMKCFAIKNNITDYAFIGNMGTEVSEERASILSEMFDECYILFDHDKAGLDGQNSAYNLLTEYMATYKMSQFLYPGKDPAVCDEEQLWKIFKSKPQKRLLVGF
jgi:DNA primase